jgi:O-methyltransferase/methyltransferase family protein
MERPPSAEFHRPRTDDRPLWDVVFGVYGYAALFIAHRLKLFPLLAEKARSLSEVCEALKIKRRPAEAILTAATSLGFLELRDQRYSLTAVAQDYLLETSPTYFGFYWDLIIDNYPVCSFASLEKAVLTDSASAYGGGDIFEAHEEQAELARSFTRGMHSISMASALAWPEAIDLAMHRLMLDVGGGSGAHSIGALLKWPNLRAVIFDLPPVCEVAEEFCARHGLEDRMQTHVGDMWKDPFPAADLHFYSYIYHDWTPEKCRFLTEKSFESLEPGGRILIHEVLYNDAKTGPFPAAAFSMIMMGWTEGEQYSGRELSMMLTDAGFRDIQVKPTFGYYSIVSGLKP